MDIYNERIPIRVEPEIEKGVVDLCDGSLNFAFDANGEDDFLVAVCRCGKFVVGVVGATANVDELRGLDLVSLCVRGGGDGSGGD